MRAETEAVVCSGPFSGGRQTYALLEERVPPVPELHPDEALAKLATAYFRSHSPASLQDFVWWSGLSVTEARHAVGLIGRSLTAERFGQRELFVHESCRAAETSGVPLYLLPAYDEYLIGYKDRTDVLRPEHRARAFTSYGIFYPVILYGRPDRGKLETPGTAGRLLRRNFVFRNGYRRRPGHPGRGRKPIPGILPRRLIFLPRK